MFFCKKLEVSHLPHRLTITLVVATSGIAADDNSISISQSLLKSRIRVLKFRNFSWSRILLHASFIFFDETCKTNHSFLSHIFFRYTSVRNKKYYISNWRHHPQTLLRERRNDFDQDLYQSWLHFFRWMTNPRDNLAESREPHESRNPKIAVCFWNEA